MRKASAMLWLALLVGCAGHQEAAPVSLRNATIDETGAIMSAELSYLPKGPRAIELVLAMRVSGLEQTDMLVSTILIKGLNVTDGSLRWTGFVLPRQPQFHRVTLQLPPGIDSATASLTLQRSADSEVLVREELALELGEDGAVAVSLQ